MSLLLSSRFAFTSAATKTVRNNGWNTCFDTSEWCSDNTDTVSEATVCTDGFAFLFRHKMYGSIELSSIRLGKNSTHLYINSELEKDDISPAPVKDDVLVSDCSDNRGIDEINKFRPEDSQLVCLQEISEQTRFWNMEMCNTIGKLANGDVKAKCVSGMSPYSVSWRTCAQNVLYNYDSGDTGVVTAVRQWNQSPSHAKTMIDPKFTYAGYNNYACPDGKYYSTVIFIQTRT